MDDLGGNPPFKETSIFIARYNILELNRVSHRTGLNAQQLFASNSAFAAITDEVYFFSGWGWISGGGVDEVPHFVLYFFFNMEDVEPQK